MVLIFVKLIKTLGILLVVVIILFLITPLFKSLFYYLTFLPKGELVKELYSPNKQHIAKIYRAETAELCVKVNIINTNTKKSKTIYWSWDEGYDATVEWVDNNNILINERKLNINTDMFNKRVDSVDKYK